MNEIQLKLNAQGQGAFFFERDGKIMGEMEIRISGSHLTVYHTEVSKELKGEGIGVKLLTTMTSYAREHHLKVIPLCPFVSAQFKRHPDLYADVWEQNWHKPTDSRA